MSNLEVMKRLVEMYENQFEIALTHNDTKLFLRTNNKEQFSDFVRDHHMEVINSNVFSRSGEKYIRAIVEPYGSSYLTV